VDAAMGSALLAASADLGSLGNAAKAMIQYEKTVEPDAALVSRYSDIYGKFLDDLNKRMK